MFIACVFLNLGMALAQTHVSGVVTSSEDGSPIIGASVKIVGTTSGTVTDIDGNFTLDVASNKAELEFSYIGMVTKKLKASDKMQVVWILTHMFLSRLSSPVTVLPKSWDLLLALFPTSVKRSWNLS